MAKAKPKPARGGVAAGFASEVKTSNIEIITGVSDGTFVAATFENWAL
jgi:hypothetical protein